MTGLKITAALNREELDSAYVNSHAAVLRHLNEIFQRVHDMPAPESNGLDWSHVGSMNRVKDDLRNIVSFLSSDDQ